MLSFYEVKHNIVFSRIRLTDGTVLEYELVIVKSFI